MQSLVLVLLTALLPGAGPTGSPIRSVIPYFSKFGDQVLSKAEVIVVGRVESVTTAVRSEVVTVEVVRTFKGEPVDTLTLLATKDEFFPGSELLLFLERFNEGPRYTAFSRISTTDENYEEKEQHLNQQLGLEQVTDEEDRRTLARNLLFENARATRTWPRRNSLRELAYVLKTYPDLIRDGDAEELTKIADMSDDEVFRRELKALLETREGTPQDPS